MVKALPIHQASENQVFMLMQTSWASAINPVLKNPLVNGIILSNLSLVSGQNSINHLLGRQPQGWLVIDQDKAASFYRSAPFNDTILYLTSSASVNVKLYVF